MSENQDETVETAAVGVSFADVAAEDPDESVAHEAEATEVIDGADGVAGTDGESANDSPPAQPTIASIMGGGPVNDGAELAP